MQINLRSLIEGLSYALDAAEKTYFSHSKHVAYLSVMIAKQMKLTAELQEDLYYAALMHDIGASNTYLLEDHCRIGRDIVSKLPVKKEIAQYIYYHHEFYNGTGPFQLKEDEIPLLAQIICISNTFELQFGRKVLLNYETSINMKNWIHNDQELFHPEIVNALQNLIEKEYILLDNYMYEFSDILAKRIETVGRNLDFDEVELFANAFSKIIDNRSPFTYEHSKGIANLVKTITEQLNYEQEIQNKMYIAALLHDIGKLVISNDIIDKKDKLNDEERYEINKHTYYTRWILEQIDGFEDITDYAANHHEKLNGSGYPYHKDANQLGELERIMAICDIYQALTEDRPYRMRLSKEKVWSIISNMVRKNELDGNLVDKIKIILKHKGGI